MSGHCKTSEDQVINMRLLMNVGKFSKKYGRLDIGETQEKHPS